MELGDIGTGKSTGNRRSSELQGPRPTPLKIHKESHKIKKPNVPVQPQPRQPIIIYTVSPKVIHTTPADFMNLVQRLTGSNSSSSITVKDDPFNSNKDGNMVSPAARYAAVEKARSSHANGQQVSHVVGGAEMGTTSMFHGILSPGPTSLSPIPPSFFSLTPPASTSDPARVNFFHDLSPLLHSGRNIMEGGFMPMPMPMPSPSSNFLVSPHTPSIDLFNHVFH